MHVKAWKRRVRLPKSIRKKEHNVHRNEGDAVAGDQILIECRKPGKWSSTRGSGTHNYFETVIQKNAYAVISKTFTNIKN